MTLPKFLAALFGRRKPPPPAAVADQSAVATAVRKACMPAIGLHRPFPPRHPVTTRSVFGGYPLAPPDFQWPRHQREEGVAEPMSFMARIDCAELPDFAGRAMLPRDGILQFFIGFDATAPAVLHHGGPSSDWIEHHPPADAPPVFGQQTRDMLPWIGHMADAEQRYPRSLAAWPVELRAFETYSIHSPFDWRTPEDAAYSDAIDDATQDSIVRVFGEPVPWLSFTHNVADATHAWRPFEGFPHSWRAIEWVAGAMLHKLVDLSGWGRRPLSAEWKAVEIAANQWIAEARTRPPMAAPDPADRSRIWAWLDGIAARPGPTDARRLREAPAYLVNGAIGMVAGHAVESSLAHSAEAAARIPPSIVDILRSGHHRMRRSTQDGRVDIGLEHQMLGRPLLIQDPAYAEDHLLLLQLVYDPAMLWTFGDVGAYQFWIREEDLRAGRFERVKLTFESH